MGEGRWSDDRLSSGDTENTVAQAADGKGWGNGTGRLESSQAGARIIMEASNIPFLCVILVLPLSASCSQLLFA